MSTKIKNTALLILGAAGALAAVNALKPSKTAGIADARRQRLDQTNTQAEQDESSSVVDRTELLKDVQRRKPWKETEAEREGDEADW